VLGIPTRELQKEAKARPAGMRVATIAKWVLHVLTTQLWGGPAAGLGAAPRGAQLGSASASLTCLCLSETSSPPQVGNVEWWWVCPSVTIGKAHTQLKEPRNILEKQIL
jgi:hypothetical protein